MAMSLVAGRLTGDHLTVTLNGLRSDNHVAMADSRIWFGLGCGATAVLEEVREAPVRPDERSTPAIPN